MASKTAEKKSRRDVNAGRVLDEAARRRRVRKALEALEQDNFHDDPHGDLGKQIHSIIKTCYHYHVCIVCLIFSKFYLILQS